MSRAHAGLINYTLLFRIETQHETSLTTTSPSSFLFSVHLCIIGWVVFSQTCNRHANGYQPPPFLLFVYGALFYAVPS